MHSRGWLRRPARDLHGPFRTLAAFSLDPCLHGSEVRSVDQRHTPSSLYPRTRSVHSRTSFMAATTATPVTVDLSASASFSVRLGASMARSTADYTSVSYNHWPDVLSNHAINATIAHGKGQLNIDDAGDKYTYSKAGKEEGYILLFPSRGNAKEAVLERLSEHVYNLASTPYESDAKKLAEKYPHVSNDATEPKSAADRGNDAEQLADPANPFDYRHFVQTVAKNTPLLQPRTVTKAAKPVIQQARQSTSTTATATKRKTQSPYVPPAKRAKPGTSSVPEQTKARPALPTIRMDRKASIRRPSYDNSGELILENEEKPAPKQRAMGLALSGQLAQGPISLRSAANSPAGRMSPVTERPEHADDDDDGEFELDAVGSPEDIVERRDNDEDDDDADADVDDLELPSPVVAEHRVSVGATSVLTGPDEDDDLDKQLERAMAEAEDEEESEEE